MKRARTATVLVFLLVLLAPPTPAQVVPWSAHSAFRQELEELSRGGGLRNPLIFVHLSCADGPEAGDPPAACEPIIRLLVRKSEIDKHRLPGLPPNLSVPEARLRVDKARLKQEKDDPTFFAPACERLGVQDLCDDGWRLAKVWTVGELAADGLRINLRTRLVKPGVVSHQIGSETPDQTVALEVPVDALGESVLILLWEENGLLNVPATYSPRG